MKVSGIKEAVSEKHSFWEKKIWKEHHLPGGLVVKRKKVVEIKDLGETEEKMDQPFSHSKKKSLI